MTESFKDNLGRAFLAVLKKHAPQNAIYVSERLLEATELIYAMEHESEGIADVPVDFQALREPRDEPRTSPPRELKIGPPPAKNAVVPQKPPGKSLIALPGDPEFTEVQNNHKAVVSAPDIRRPTRAASNVPEVQYWDPAELIQTLSDNTPPELQVETEDREGHPRSLTVLRNIHNNAGLGTVTLAYKHASVSDTDGYLTARASFSVYSKDIDVEAGMEKIKAQVAGMYRPKPESMEPTVGPDPGPLRIENAAMRDKYESHFEPGARMVADPHTVVKTGIQRDNDRLAPSGRRF